MYYKDKKKSLTIRLNSNQNDFLTMLADTCGTTKTNILRGFINKAMGSRDLYEYKQTHINDKF